MSSLSSHSTPIASTIDEATADTVRAVPEPVLAVGSDVVAIANLDARLAALAIDDLLRAYLNDQPISACEPRRSRR